MITDTLSCPHQEVAREGIRNRAKDTGGHPTHPLPRGANLPSGNPELDGLILTGRADVLATPGPAAKHARLPETDAPSAP